MVDHSMHTMPTRTATTERALKISGWLTGTYFVIELGIGLHSGSVAVTSDAFHTFSAVGGVVLAFVAARLARRPADLRRLRASFATIWRSHGRKGASRRKRLSAR